MLYQMDIRHSGAQQAITDFWETHEQLDADVKAYANRLVEGTLARRPEIDQRITAHADNWNMSRMAVIDRNILRLGAFELLYLDDVPAKVCINEAIELAKRFGDAESGKFINGVLDAIHKKGSTSRENR